MIAAVLAALVGTSSIVAAQLNVVMWSNNTAFAPPSAGVVTNGSQIAWKGFVDDYASVVVTGTVTNTLGSSGEDLLFSVYTDGAVRLWINNHLVVDNATTVDEPRWADCFQSVPFVPATPQSIRLEYQHMTGPSILMLYWATNSSAKQVSLRRRTGSRAGGKATG